ncbi:unnamed protein product [Pleuronectes platessa]|uniref:Uncharacterized protein n=1 Tax=Pleuronectes platessa TaxID=8262 RepID=A0A9N7YKU5_PLEPL|nr:unnamed protein product [Pleuronectes platessa]
MAPVNRQGQRRCPSPGLLQQPQKLPQYPIEQNPWNVAGLIEGDDGTEVNPLLGRKLRECKPAMPRCAETEKTPSNKNTIFPQHQQPPSSSQHAAPSSPSLYPVCQL